MSGYSSAGTPRFVEPEYDLDHSKLSIKEAKPDGCCGRCGSECRQPGWFAIQEGEKTLDIPASFGPTSWKARLVKFCMMAWFNATLIYKWYSRREYAAFFMAFLTHWGMIFACLWLTVSFINSIFPPAQPKMPHDPVSLRTKFSWLLFTVASHFTLIVVVLYWALDFQPGESTIDYINIFSHALVLLIWPEGLLIDRIPIRWKHLPVPMFLAACYVAWLVIHQLATDIGVPTRNDTDPETNDDLLYPAIDFEDKTVFSSILCTLVVFVFVPLMHWLLWSLSLFSFPCNCSGYIRRYLVESNVKSPSNTVKSTDNVNIYEP